MPRYAVFFAALVALAAAAVPAAAQQNLFNVPSAEATPQGNIFFQNQFNLNRVIQSNTTLCYGLGWGAEIGLNLFDIPLYNPGLGGTSVGREIQQPDFLVNGLKTVEFTDWFRAGLGTQIGQTAPVFESRVRLVNFTYLTGVFQLPEEKGQLYFGPYYANRAYRGSGDQVGLMFGCDIPIVEKKVHFVADYLSGRNDLSVAVIGAVVYLPGNWQLSLGAQLPGIGTKNTYGGVIELTYVPSKAGGGKGEE